MKKIPFLLFTALILFPGCSRAFNLSNFDAPESIQVDPETGSYYISNIGGDPMEKDGNGFISKVTANSNIIIQRYIGGKPENAVLNAPKGLAILGKKLIVTDIDAIRVFDKETGKAEAVVDLAPWDVKYLNDIAADRFGNLFVSDTLTNRIFKVSPADDYKVTVFSDSPALNGPNGLIVNPRNHSLMVVTWDGGQILEIDPTGKIHVLKRGLKGLDGIDYDDEGNLYVSSLEKGEVYRIPFYGRGLLSVFLSGLTEPADISCDRKKSELLVPSFSGNTLITYPLNPKKRSAGDAQ